jgi:hypothetical protein
MTLPNRPRYAARLNAFKVKGGTVADMIRGAGQVGGLTSADLNYPDHFDHAHDAGAVVPAVVRRRHGAERPCDALLHRGGFRLGAFTHPEAGVRRAAIDLTKRGIDACAAMGGSQMTLWMGQDGFDYSFQADYARMWDDTIAAIAEVATTTRPSTSPSNTSPMSPAPMR